MAGSPSMAKYDPLRAFFRRQKAPTVELSFNDVERLVGRLLPKAAWSEDWWTAEDAVQTRSWRAAGFAAMADPARERVQFTRCIPPHEHRPFVVQKPTSAADRH